MARTVVQTTNGTAPCVALRTVEPGVAEPGYSATRCRAVCGKARVPAWRASSAPPCELAHWISATDALAADRWRAACAYARALPVGRRRP